MIVAMLSRTRLFTNGPQRQLAWGQVALDIVPLLPSTPVPRATVPTTEFTPVEPDEARSSRTPGVHSKDSLLLYFLQHAAYAPHETFNGDWRSSGVCQSLDATYAKPFISFSVKNLHLDGVSWTSLMIDPPISNIRCNADLHGVDAGHVNSHLLNSIF